MMQCNEFRELLSAWLDGELSEEESAGLAEHLAVCHECSECLAEYRQISSAVSSLAVEPPENLASGIMYRVSLETKKGGGRRFGRFTAIAAVIALLLITAASFKGLIPGLEINTTSSALSESPEAQATAAPAGESEDAPVLRSGGEQSETTDDTDTASQSDTMFAITEGSADEGAEAKSALQGGGTMGSAASEYGASETDDVYATITIYGAVPSALEDTTPIENEDGSQQYTVSSQLIKLLYDSLQKDSADVSIVYGNESASTGIVVVYPEDSAP